MPDLFVLRKDWLHLFGEYAIVGSPDIIVEVHSPSTRRADLEVKRRRYERAGVLEHWIADPIAQTVILLSLQDGKYVEILPVNGRLASVPGLAVDVQALVAGLD